MKTGQGLAAYAISLLGQPYMYGNNGLPISVALINAKKIQYPDKYSAAKIIELMKHLGEIGYDCSAVKDTYVGTDKKADTWLAEAEESGPISTIPEIVGLTVHSPGHMGVYIGNGQVVEARGTFYGVVQTALKDRPWKNWAKSAVLNYEEEDNIMITRSDVPTKEVYDLQVVYKALGLNIGAWADMVNGSPTGCDGKFGPTMELRTEELQAKHGLPVTGSVDAATYGKIALALLEKNTGITQAQLDAAVAATKSLNEKITELETSNLKKTAELTNVAFSLRQVDAVKARY